MNKKGQWNIGIGTVFILTGVYLLTRGKVETIILGIILMSIGAWLITK